MVDLFELAQEESNEIRIKKIILENYRNIPYKEYLIDNKGMVLSGKNGLGKTNVIEAIYWVLSGKLFNGLSQGHMVGITPVSSEKDTKTSVEIHFTNDFSCKKVFYNTYDKEGNYKGSETAYYINGALEKRNKQAESLIREMIGLGDIETRFKGTKLESLDTVALFHLTTYLKEIDYKLMRELITNMVGEIDFKQIINQKPQKYAKLVEPLKKHSLELETLREAKRNEKFGTKDKKGLLDLISGTEESIKNFELEANKEIDVVAIENAKKKLSESEEKIIDLKVMSQKSSSDLTNDIDLKISKKETEYEKALSKIKEEHQKYLESLKDVTLEKELTSKQESLNKLRNEKLDLDEKISTEDYNSRTMENDIKNLKSSLSTLRETREKLLVDWKNVKENNPEKVEKITCPHCEKQFGMHESLEHLSIQKSRLEQISEMGKNVKVTYEEKSNTLEDLSQEHERLLKTIKKLQDKRTQLNTNIEVIRNDINAIEEKLRKPQLQARSIDFKIEPLLTLENEIETLKTQKNNVLTNYQEERSKILNQIFDLEESQNELKTIISQEQTILSYKKSADNLRKELEDLNFKLNDVDDILELIKMLQRETFELLEQKVKDVFGDNIRFQLYKTNTDGSIDVRFCEMFVKDKWNNYVNIKTINNGMYPIRALEFISRIKKNYNIKKTFVFVDEIGNLDDEHVKMLSQFDEQVIATKGTNKEQIEKEMLL